MRTRLVLAVVGAVLWAAPAIAADATGDDQAVKAVLTAYSQSVAKLDAASATPLFAPDAHIFEQGGDEGTWPYYLEHHLRPEFAEFKSFRFRDYKAGATISGDLAIAWESYGYTIELKEGGAPVERLGAATSVLRKTPEGWKIVQYHSSSRKPDA